MIPRVNVVLTYPCNSTFVLRKRSSRRVRAVGIGIILNSGTNFFILTVFYRVSLSPVLIIVIVDGLPSRRSFRSPRHQA